jgi:hypothetical protein
MVEFDRSQERNWYKLHVAGIAEFVVCSYTEDGGMLKVDLYSAQHRKPVIDTR